ncbi:MAG: HesA/MoeB/ThiF family protein [Bacteroidota bacterium]
MMEHSPRYIRQTSLPDFGPEGQMQLRKGKVLIVGLGGLGVPVAQYLNAMGIGTLGLMDNDSIALHNLQRQVLYAEEDVGQPKIAIAKKKLEAQNCETHIDLHQEYLSAKNALDILSKYDVIVDATDNFGTRYLINDACVLLNKPFVYGALQGFEGQVSVFNYKAGPTYRCVFPDPPKGGEIPSCNENGILGVLPGIIGTLQALEVVKLLSGKGQLLSGTLLLYDGNIQMMQKIKLKTFPKNKKITALQPTYGIPGCETTSPVVRFEVIQDRTVMENIQLIDVRDPEEFVSYHLKSAINIPLTNLEDHLIRIDLKRPVYFICQSGKRSGYAVRKMQELLPKAEVYSIEGGMIALPDTIKLSL